MQKKSFIAKSKNHIYLLRFYAIILVIILDYLLNLYT